MKIIDLTTWERREHFAFFNRFDDPCFSVDAQLNAGALIKYCQQHNCSLYVSYVFLSLKAANSVPAMRLRLENNQLVEYERVHGSTTFLNHANVFGFCHLNYHTEFDKFYPKAAQKLAQSKQKSDNLLAEDPRLDVIYYSVLPWISFTSFKHPVTGEKQPSVPKIMFGKIDKELAEPKLPVSVSVNHALMDGYHVGQFFEAFQALLLAPEKHLIHNN